MDPSTEPYHEPLALIIISSISIGLGAIAALLIALDIIWRKGWKSMMGIMIPVYVINALYLWPLTLWVYLNYGRPTKPSKGVEMGGGHCHGGGKEEKKLGDEEDASGPVEEDRGRATTAAAASNPTCHEADPAPFEATEKQQQQSPSSPSSDEEKATPPDAHAHCHSSGAERPLFATLTVAVCHCGAGCVLGDIVGEWIVYGTNATISGRSLWPEYLIDFGFAILFGLIFQYFSIAPMSGDYSPKTLWRALKADFFSLMFFEIGLFGWMAIFQIAIFDWRLEMNTVTYWWMMQIGMFCGHWTGVPVNWWLIKTGVKEPCA